VHKNALWSQGVSAISEAGLKDCLYRLVFLIKRLDDLKIRELRPDSRRVNLEATVASVAPVREVTLKTGERATVTDVTIEDDTGSTVLTLWNENADKVREGAKVRIENGYVSTFRGEMRLNVGRYGKLEIL
jgi:replication factor A1